MNTSSNLETDEYLALGNSGKSSWWRYLGGLIFILIAYIIVGTLAYMAFMVIANGGRLPSKGSDIDPFIGYVGLNLSFFVLLFFTYCVVRFVLCRPLLSLITPYARVSLKLIAIGFVTWFSLNSVGTLIGFLVYPGSYKFSLEVPKFFYLLPLVLLLTPVQCFSEEVLFRGYILQFLGKATRSIWVLSIVNGLLFLLPHLINPEMSGPDPIAVGLGYFLIGCVFSFVTIRTNSLEVAIGAHIANNLFAALIVNYSNSALQTRSIFLCTQIHAWFETAMLAVLGLTFCILIEKLVGGKRRPPLT